MIKYIITGGCSFSNGGHATGWTGYLTKYIKNINPNVEFIHTGYLSQGQELIQKKIMYNLTELFEKGINGEEILVIVMWSGTGRKAWYVDNHYIIEKMIADMPSFEGGMCKQFLDFNNNIVGDLGYFKTKNGSEFEYSRSGGWYFTVNGSESKQEFIKEHYLLDREPNGIGKVHESLENIVMLQNFCDLYNIKIVHQCFMDSVHQDIERYKDHQIIKYLHKQLNPNYIVKDGMFEFLHGLMNIPKEKAIYISHQDRLKIQGDNDYFASDGFHPGETGSKLWCEKRLFLFLKQKKILSLLNNENPEKKFFIPLLYDYVLPNYILPNALITELGLINYLHSLYSNKLTRNSFFEQSLHAGNDVVNPLTFLFGENLGIFPNSSGGESTHLLSGMYNEILDCSEQSLYFGKNKYSKYIYPIKISPHIVDFTGVTETGSKLNGEYFWKHMSAEALNDARNGKAIILLDYAQENYIEMESYIRLHECIRISGIPKQQIILAFNSFNAQELYESWFPENQRWLLVKNWPFVLSNTSYYYSHVTGSTISLDKFLTSKNRIRDNYFIFKIRRPRMYRQSILYKLYSDGLLEKGDWSCLQKLEIEDYQIDHFKNVYNFDLNNEKIKKLGDLLPHRLKDEAEGTYDTISSWTDIHTKSYENAYFYICTETYTHGEHKSVTEKVCKPLVNFMPFVFVSFKGALKHLHDLGFKTFHPFIDESYDEEPDEFKRVNMIYKEIEKLCNKTKQELHEWYWQMEHIYIHNNNHLLEFYKNDTYSRDFIKYLNNRIND